VLNIVETMKLCWYLISCRNLEGKHQNKVGATVSNTITSERLEIALCLVLLTLPPKKKTVFVEGETVPDLSPLFSLYDFFIPVPESSVALHIGNPNNVQGYTLRSKCCSDPKPVLLPTERHQPSFQ